VFRKALGTHTFDADLERAGIEKKTPRGSACFHSLRKTYLTGLQRVGLHPRAVQTLARHTDINLTMGSYTDAAQIERRDSVELLPELFGGVRRSVRAEVAERLEASSDVTANRTQEDGDSPRKRAKGQAMSRIDTDRSPVDEKWSRGESNPREIAALGTARRV
jgi:hypothetical protein